MDEEMEFVVGEEFADAEFDFDFDYEFDAVRYFDFTRPESIEDGTEAESWFESARSYPPSRKHFVNYSNFRLQMPFGCVMSAGTWCLGLLLLSIFFLFF